MSSILSQLARILADYDDKKEFVSALICDLENGVGTLDVEEPDTLISLLESAEGDADKKALLELLLGCEDLEEHVQDLVSEILEANELEED